MAWQAENIAFIIFTGRPQQERPGDVFGDVFGEDFDEVSAEPGPFPGKRASTFEGAIRKSVLIRPGRIDIIFDSPRNDPPMLDEPASVLQRFLPTAQTYVSKHLPNRVSCIANLMLPTEDEITALDLFYEATSINKIQGAYELSMRYNKRGKVANYRSNFIYDYSVSQLQFMEFQIISGQTVPSGSPMKSLFYFKKMLDFNSVPIPSIPSEDASTLLAEYAKEIIREINDKPAS